MITFAVGVAVGSLLGYYVAKSRADEEIEYLRAVQQNHLRGKR